MIEFPEAATLARQMGVEQSSKRVTCCLRGNSPPRFAFYSYPPEQYTQVMTGAVLGDTRVGGEHTLVLGGGILLPQVPGLDKPDRKDFHLSLGSGLDIPL